jgi:hypothetical protein
MKDLYTCYYCGTQSDKVECQGIYYCPNACCTGPGGGWFRRKLKSYKENKDGTHSVNEKEYYWKAKLYTLKRKLFPWMNH